MRDKGYFSQIKALKLQLSFLVASICAVPLIAASEGIGVFFKDTAHELLIKSTFLTTGLACVLWFFISMPTLLIIFLMRLAQDDPRNAAFSGGILILSTLSAGISGLAFNVK